MNDEEPHAQTRTGSGRPRVAGAHRCHRDGAGRRFGNRASHAVANGRLLAEALPDATYSEIRAAGHVVHLEQPALIAETISSFMNDLHLTHP